MTTTVDASTRVRARLAGAPALADLPTDRPRPARPTGATASLSCPSPHVDDATLVAAVAALLHRYTGQDDVLIAAGPAAAAGAPAGSVAVVRSRLDGDPTWSELAAAVTADLTDAGAAGAVPAASIAVGSPTRGDDGALPAVHVAVGTGPSARDGFDVCVDRAGDELRWSFATDVLDEPTVQRMAGHLARLADAVAHDPALALSRIPLLSPAERAQLVIDWNATRAEFSDGATVIDLVRAQGARTPNTTAAVFEDGASLTYAELLAAGHRLAHSLASVGVEPGSLVGVYLERSLDMLVALVGVLAAGAAYVPLDPSFPPDRLAMMVEDSGLATLVTQRSLASALPIPASVQRVVVDDPATRDAVAAQPADAPAVDSDCRRLAYVIYTSGSTGRPKGVMLEHRSVVNFLESMAREPGLQPTDRLLAVTTLSFDIAGLELWLPLVVGATVVIASRSTATDPQALQDAFARHGITVMQATPATWRMLVEAGWDGKPSIRVLCGGEALPPALAAALVERGREVWNLYGPTETTIWSTLQRVEPGAPVSIGRPIANTTLYVLDPAMEPVPIGVAGELHIGGDGLARGYHDRAELTADRFVPDPFDDRPGARLYRTGDLVRYRADGRIEFLGRIDQQVKVRGFRIELGEIEAVLGRQTGVDEAIVLARDDPAGEKRLVAYVTRTTDARDTLTASTLRRSVRDVLPHYMVPSVVVFLDGMPRTPNGKTDRKAMPEPDWSLIGRDGAFVAPRDEVETRMAALWEEQLGLDGIGVRDDFFELGVESLVAARLFARIEREFGIELPVGTVFENPTVEGLAAIVRDAGSARAPRWPSLVPIQPAGERRPIFAVHGGAGTILLYGELARRLEASGRPFYGLQAQGLYGHDPVHTSVEAMARAYVPQIREVQPHGPYTLAGYCYGSLVAYEMAHILEQAGERVDVVIAINGPAVPYIRRHDPGGTLDLGGSHAQRNRQRGWKFRVRNALRYRWMVAQVVGSIVARRPLPQPLRENYVFQRISIRAQFRYEAPSSSVPMLVFSAAGLYVEDDLGWRAHTSAPVRGLSVPGHQPEPRDTMKEPTVGFIARELDAALRQLETA